MSPPKKQVSPGEAIQVCQYFRDNWKRHDRFLKDQDMVHGPEKALEGVWDLRWDEEEFAQGLLFPERYNIYRIKL